MSLDKGLSEAIGPLVTTIGELTDRINGLEQELVEQGAGRGRVVDGHRPHGIDNCQIAKLLTRMVGGERRWFFGFPAATKHARSLAAAPWLTCDADSPVAARGSVVHVIGRACAPATA